VVSLHDHDACSDFRITKGMDTRCSVLPWQVEVNIRWLIPGITFKPRAFPALTDGWYEVQVGV